MKPARLPAVSLFTNCGAGDLGYARAGFRFEVVAELDSGRLDIAALNLPHAVPVPGDLRETWPEVVDSAQRRLDDRRLALLAACPPCQGMSSARSGRGLSDDADAGSRDDRNLLVDVIARVATALSPRIIVVENVVAFLTRKVRHPDTGHPTSAASLLIERLSDRYEAFAMRSDLADFGVPQTRRRSFLALISRSELGLARLTATRRTPFPAPTHGIDADMEHVPLGVALAQLGAARLDGSSLETAGVGLHSVPVWNAQRYAMVAAIPTTGGAGAWDNDRCAECGVVEVDENAAACPRCGGPLARPVVHDNGAWRLIKGFRNSSYTRMSPGRPAATITTASGRVGSDNTLHPTEHRVLSMLECQHLQTFPREFRWGDHLARRGHTSLREMIGEAVPPQFTHLHGKVLRSVLDGRSPARAMSARDARVLTAERRLAEDRNSD